MRNYAKVSPRFWIGTTGLAIRGDSDAQLVALYMMTCPNSTMTGAYYLPIPYIAHETGVGIEAATKAVETLIGIGFCEYEQATEYVFVREMARFQIEERLNIGDKRIAGIKKELSSMLSNRMRMAFVARYNACFNLGLADQGLASPFQGPMKAPLSQEQEQEQEQQQEKEQEQAQEFVSSPSETLVEPDGPTARRKAAARREQFAPSVRAVFDYWRTAMDHLNSKLGTSDGKRYRNIADRLREGYSVSDLMRAVDGCGLDPFSMGDNDRNTKYDDIELICRTPQKVEHFIAIANGTGGYSGPGAELNGNGRKTAQAAQEFVDSLMAEND